MEHAQTIINSNNIQQALVDQYVEQKMVEYEQSANISKKASPYNIFMKFTIPYIKSQCEISHKDAFIVGALLWKTSRINPKNNV